MSKNLGAALGPFFFLPWDHLKLFTLLTHQHHDPTPRNNSISLSGVYKINVWIRIIQYSYFYIQGLGLIYYVAPA